MHGNYNLVIMWNVSGFCGFLREYMTCRKQENKNEVTLNTKQMWEKKNIMTQCFARVNDSSKKYIDSVRALLQEEKESLSS